MVHHFILYQNYMMFPLVCNLPIPSFHAVFCLICGRQRVAVARYLMICLDLVNLDLFPLPRGAGSTVHREGFNF